MKLYRCFLILLALLCVVPPLTAQEATLNTVTFNGFSFQYPSDFASSLQVRQVIPLEELDNPVPQDMPLPSYVLPPSTGFFLTTTTPLQEQAFAPADQLHVYRIADFAEYHPYYMENVAALQKLLDEQPDLTTYRPMPYLGLASSAILAHQAYIETKTLRGVAYISEFLPLAVMSVGPGTLVYTFQALSKDGQYYVTASFHLVLPSIPTPTSDDPATLTEAYYANIQALVDAAQPADFTPNLAVIEAIFASMEMNRDPFTTPGF